MYPWPLYIPIWISHWFTDWRGLHLKPPKWQRFLSVLTNPQLADESSLQGRFGVAVVTCKMLTGRSAVSWEWELDGWGLSWNARSPSPAESSCEVTNLGQTRGSGERRQHPPMPILPAAIGSGHTGPRWWGRAESGPHWLSPILHCNGWPRAPPMPLLLYTSFGWTLNYLTPKATRL